MSDDRGRIDVNDVDLTEQFLRETVEAIDALPDHDADQIRAELRLPLRAMRRLALAVCDRATVLARCSAVNGWDQDESYRARMREALLAQRLLTLLDEHMQALPGVPIKRPTFPEVMFYENPTTHEVEVMLPTVADPPS
jgi:hypothetical protein